MNLFLHRLLLLRPSALIFIFSFRRYPVAAIAITAYIIFTALNIYGVKAAATFELIITVFAVFELLLFAGVTLPHFEIKNLQLNASHLAGRVCGPLSLLPSGSFLAIEGVANVAEETINPQKNILRGFGSALATLIILVHTHFSWLQ